MRTVQVADARRLLLAGHGLLDGPARDATLPRVLSEVRRLGYVQIDSINVIERAHHLILAARLDGYRQAQLHKLLERGPRLFEHWTHDASAIPVEWFPYWKIRFERARSGRKLDAWWRQRFGERPQAVLDHVVERIAREGPLRSADFEHDRKGEPGGWWAWKPQKAALEVLWRRGTLSIARRDGFQKVYDLTERVLPEASSLPRPDDADHVEWACREALQRLGPSTAAQIARYLNAISVAEAAAWCRRCPDVEAVRVEPEADGPAQNAWVLRGWQPRARRLRDAPGHLRLLCPFDPVLRDRQRTERLFRFDYRFEAFTPQAKRRYGYYVMPILEADRFVGRLDPKLHRDRGELQVRGLWWEKGVKPTRARRAALRAAVERLAELVGATKIRGA